MLSDLEIIPNGPRREISEMEAVECASLHIESAGKIGAYAIYVKSYPHSLRYGRSGFRVGKMGEHWKESKLRFIRYFFGSLDPRIPGIPGSMDL